MKNSTKNWRIAINPFEIIAGRTALVLGLAFLMLSTLTGTLFNARFDGLLNVHFTSDVQWQTLALDLMISLLSITVLLFLFALALGKRQTRFIDILGSSTLAFAPLCLAPLANSTQLFTELANKVEANPASVSSILQEHSIIALMLGIVFLLLIVIWHVGLLFNAYKVSSNLKESRLIVSFILAVLLASGGSQYLIYLISKL